ncbi:MAG TPA: tetratricopeptide repeat protein [Rhodanobacteraceae bacterium]|nr:tetratricopeptide repeat protein [Rhodanobacteraceae bacterium]
MSVAFSDIEDVVALIERGDAAGAEARALQALNTQKNDAELTRLHGVALLMLGRAAEARVEFERAIELAPQEFAAYCNLSSALLSLDDPPGALHAIERALAVMPANAPLWNALANACVACGDHQRARNVYRAALNDAPDDPRLLLNLAATEMALGEMSEAERLVRTVLAHTQVPQAWLLLGHIHRSQRQFERARQAYERGAALAPGDAIFPHHCGLVDEELNRFESALGEYRRALKLNPDLVPALSQLAFVQRRVYDWRDSDAFGAKLRSLALQGNPDVAPFSLLAENSTAEEQLACARAQARRVISRTGGGRLLHAPAKPADAPLRVGFVSAGFHAHPTALLVAHLFEELAKLDLEIHLFATSPDDGSAIRQRLRATAQEFHDVSALTPAMVAQRTRDAGIDILIDLDVWCGGGMPGAFALRPAPIQVNWLGYPGTSGAEFYDYIIADRFVLPEGLREHFSERVVYLPRCYQPSDATREIPESPPRRAFHLPEDSVVFASFNNSWKLNAQSFARMCAVLREAPGSVLWLLDAGREADERLRAMAQAYGVDPRRLVFSPKLPHAQHLGRHALADLFLDTHPYNAHTTASDALWAGCPVLTCPGDTFAARVAGSLNHHLKMDAMNARDEREFIETAVNLARDSGSLSALRIRLQRRKRETGLFEMRGYARDFAALLHAMWVRKREGSPPEDIDGSDLRLATLE